MYVCLCKFLQTTIKFCVKWIIKLEFLQEFVLHFGFGHATIRKGAAASVAGLKASTFLNEVVTLVQKCSLSKTRGKFFFLSCSLTLLKRHRQNIGSQKPFILASFKLKPEIFRKST